MKFDIATAIRRTQKRWANKKITWDDLVEKLRNTTRTPETINEYMRAPKMTQASLKDVGGFVGGYLNEGKRGNGFVRHRQIVTLDIDNCDEHVDVIYERITDNLAYDMCVYSTHKHTSEKPRLRVVFPLDRPVDAEEYEAISRWFAGEIGIDFFDPTTFQPARLMYWPSTSSNGEFFFQEQFGGLCGADEILANYVDWKDISAWPRLSTENPELERSAKQQGNPLEKTGWVGAFCRAYSVPEAIENFLENVYEESGEGRYTYIDGSTSGGAILYHNGVFLYSHHSTDPAHGKLLNAFDLVRIHKFGGLDGDNTGPITKTESYGEMIKLCSKDKNAIAALDDVENPLSSAVYTDFAEEIEEAENSSFDLDSDILDEFFGTEGSPVSVINSSKIPDFYKPEFKGELPDGTNEHNWKDKLQRDKKGNITSMITNLKLILMFDEDLKGKISWNDFDQSIFVVGRLPWNSSNELREWEDADDSGLRELLETKYDTYHISKSLDALVLTAMYNRFHPVRTFLKSLEWDGVPRLDTLLIDCYGAEDSEYVRAVTRKTFTAAVARVFNPGCKFDYVLTLVSPEGYRKSSLFGEMAGRWFSDSFTTVDGTKAFEQLQGSWILEIAELAGFNKADTTSIKSFVTKRFDRYRFAYGKHVANIPRQCVFVATTNEATFLKGNTGNRRFWPVKLTKKFQGYSVAEKSGNGAEVILGLPVQQLWAEAVHYYNQKEPLYLSEKLEAMAKKHQEQYSESDDRLGLIEEYLDLLLPIDWDNMTKLERREYILDNTQHVKGVNKRDFICTSEIWEECLGFQLRDLNNHKTKELISLLSTIAGWERKDSKRSFKHYGSQRYFMRTQTVKQVK